MGVFVRVLVVVVALGAAFVVQNYRQMTRSAPVPQLDDKKYWGPGSGANYKENTAIKPFDISVAGEVLEDLKAQLSRPLRLHEPLEGIAFEYGFNANHLTEVVKYWRDNYLPRWSEREKYLKQFKHAATEIQGLRIHFVHAKPSKPGNKKVVPLLLLHGWPGSVREFYDIIPKLTTPNAKSDYVFEVIAPSLPGYGWSQAASKPNFGPAQMAVIFRTLMLRLGHERFMVQGGDWGALIGSSLTTLYQQNVIGFHSNMCGSNHPLSQFNMILTRIFPMLLCNKEHSDFYPGLGTTFSALILESGYMHIQATKPDTIGTALSHNPVGLAAYILEKFSTWTNPAYRQLKDGGLTKRYSLDALLDNVMIYYVTNSITTSQRLYSEAFTSEQFGLQLDSVHVNVPVGCARFRHDLLHSTDCQLKYHYKNLVHSTHHKDGGHFAAMEVPQTLYDDFTEFAQKALKP